MYENGSVMKRQLEQHATWQLQVHMLNSFGHFEQKTPNEESHELQQRQTLNLLEALCETHIFKTHMVKTPYASNAQ